MFEHFLNLKWAEPLPAPGTGVGEGDFLFYLPVSWHGLCVFLIFDLNPPGCGALFLLRAAERPCKKQTAAPAPPRLYLPQAAARLRSPPPF